jgi:hypothetical protein
MRKSGWAAAAGLVSAALLLTACGGGSSNTNNAGAGASSTSSAAAESTGSASGGNNGGATPTASANMSSPPPGTVYFTVQHSAKGWIMAEAGKPVYTYAGDTKGKAGTFTGSGWAEVKAQNPQPSAADSLPGTLGQIDGQATYNGMPLYIKVGGADLAVYPSSQWKLVPMSKSDVKSS